ncbi:DUF47 domain-containing protein [Nesterenkonia lutea]|uniref:Uncharacterized protein Yka (UPF0111/DUF47 family) n=1 Tax=Nesterenkonia lutea TaxID=272919 RepID=A0ABR9JGX1_9MICC|nr:nuclease PIN [Nesterenkonia lutea]MBE1525030.1 uncharacterized protein Yka (UPF0111/DUF47 family) [Nesterenkonia lutea]
MIVRRGQRQPVATDLLAGIAREVRSGVHLISQLLGSTHENRAELREQLIDLEGRAMDLHFNLMTHIRSVFLTPLPRQDIYALSQQLNRTMEHVVAAGDLILARPNLSLPAQSADQLETLSRQLDLTVAAMSRLEDFDLLEEYWIQMQRLTKQANRTHRVWMTSSDNAFQPNIALQQSQIADALLAAVHDQRTVAVTAGSIIVRES